MRLERLICKLSSAISIVGVKKNKKRGLLVKMAKQRHSAETQYKQQRVKTREIILIDETEKWF